MSSSPDQRHRQFLRLFTTTEPALRRFVRSLVPTVADADDVLQEVAVTLWEKFAEFEGDDAVNFQRWAFGIAKFKVLSWRRDRGRDRHVFSDEMTDLLATESRDSCDRMAAQQEALGRCLEKLESKQRSLVETAYQPGKRIDHLAALWGRTAMSLYKQLHRIRLVLVDCTRTEMKKAGW